MCNRVYVTTGWLLSICKSVLQQMGGFLADFFLFRANNANNAWYLNRLFICKAICVTVPQWLPNLNPNCTLCCCCFFVVVVVVFLISATRNHEISQHAKSCDLSLICMAADISSLICSEKCSLLHRLWAMAADISSLLPSENVVCCMD